MSWGLEWNGMHPLLGAAAAAAAGWAVLRLRRDEARNPGLRDALRLGAVVMLAIALVDPVVTAVRSRTEAPAVAVVIDRSGSMAAVDADLEAGARIAELAAVGWLPPGLRPDAAARSADALRRRAGPDWRPEALRALAEELAGDAVLGPGLARLAEARDAGGELAESELGSLEARALAVQAGVDAAIAASAERAPGVEQALIRFAETSRRDRALALAERMAASLPSAAVDWFVLDDRLVPVDGPPGARAALSGSAATDLGEGMATLARGWAGRGHPSACIVLSDGRRTAGADPEPAVRALASRGVRVHAVCIGDPDPPERPAVAALEGPAEAVAGEPVSLNATVRAPDGSAWEVQWLRDGLEQARSPLPAGGGWHRVGMVAEAGPAGVALWQARVLPAGAATGGSPPAGCAVAVAAAPPVVVVIDAAPRWELRHAIDALRSGLGARIVPRWRTPAGEPGPLLPASGQLAAADLLVVGDVAPEELGPDGPGRIAAFATQRGGCVILVGGPAAMPAAYGLGPLAEILPVLPSSIDASQATPAGVRPGPGAGRILGAAETDWGGLPPLPWWLRGVSLRSGAEAVLIAADRGLTPLVAVAERGAGRVAWIGSDALWRWRQAGDMHATLWLRLARWGLGARLSGADRRLQVAVDRAVAGPGETINLRVRAMDADARPAGPPVLRLDGPAGSVGRRPAMLPVVDQPGMWTAEIGGAAAALDEGRWTLAVELAGLVERRELLVRIEPGLELADTTPDRSALDRLAAAGGGEAVAPERALGLAGRLAAELSPRRVELQTSTALAQGPWWFGVLALLLLGEWLLRRRSGLP